MTFDTRARITALACAFLIALGALVLWSAGNAASHAERELRDQLRRTMSRAHELDLLVRPALAASSISPENYLAQADAMIVQAEESLEREALERVRACLGGQACAEGVDAAVLRVKSAYARPLREVRHGRERAAQRRDTWTTVGVIAIVIGAVFLVGLAWMTRKAVVAVRATDSLAADDHPPERIADDGKDASTSATGSARDATGEGRADTETGTRPARRKRAISFSDIVSAEMEETLRSRLEQLYQAKKRARENERFAAFGEIAAGLSHGLKTPLACVRAAAQVAQAKIGFDHPAHENLDDIIDQVDGLVDQIVRFLATMGEGAPSLERIRAREIVRALDEYYKRRPGARGVTWACVVDERVEHVTAEPELIQMALRNLIDNAYSVAPEGTEVCLSVSPCGAPLRAGLDESEPAEALRDALWTEFSVRDHGPGIPRDVITKERVTSTRRGGSGLGLAIARRIAARHGGRLLLESDVETGTLTRLVLPPVGADADPDEPTGDHQETGPERPGIA